MPTLTATAARKDFLKIIREANQKHEVYRIHHLQTSLKQMEREETVSFEDAFGEPR